LKRIFLYLNTLRYLRFRQVFYRLYYLFHSHGLPASIPASLSPANNLRETPGSSCPFLASPVSFHDGGFTFLNRFKWFQDDLDWSFDGYGKLWTYNLNYFEYLNQPDMTPDEGMKLIRSFLAGMQKNRIGMEPYPVSMRGISWIKFLTRWGIKDEKIDRELYRQYRHLHNNLEYHLMGNHLLENGFSLLFGACYFGSEELDKKAEKILRKELTEQILADGGHFERSPMYHQIILGRVLDCINMLKDDGGFYHIKLLLHETAERMLGWLREISFSDGRIPLFNDAAFGIAPTSGELFTYAERLGVHPSEKSLKESGYRKITDGIYEAIVDVGAIGPDYIPGHAHADTLNFEMHIGGCPVIVDTGTSTYGDDGGTDKDKAHAQTLRQKQRATAAHNAVEIDGLDSSEVWGGFRVAKRAYPLDLHIDESADKISCAHDGYRRLPGKPIHRREWQFYRDGMTIRDEIRGSFQTAVGRLHFHPDLRLIPDSEIDKSGIDSGSCNSGKILLPDGRSMRWKIEKGQGRLSDTTWHPGFGVSIPNKCLEIHFMGRETMVDLSWR
jgi:hypothetical protein